MHSEALHLGFVTIHWYGVLMAVAFLAGIANCIYLGRKVGKDAGFMSDLGCWIMISGVVGARIGHVIANFKEYSADPVTILYVHRGGLIFYGGFAGAAVAILLFAFFKREKVLGLYDIAVVAVPLAHAFGRVGCFMKGCCYGKLTSSPLGVRFPLDSDVGSSQLWHNLVANPQVQALMARLNHSQISSATFNAELDGLVSRGVVDAKDAMCLPVQPVQLYEAGLNILLYLGLMWYFRRRKCNGSVVAMYLVGYPVIRFSMELLRGDERQMLVGPLNAAQVISIGMFIVGAVSLGWFYIRDRIHTHSNVG